MSTADGRVYEVDSSREALIERIRKAKDSKAPLHLTIKGDQIIAARAFSATEARAYADQLDEAKSSGDVEKRDMDADFGYSATVLGSMQDAQNLFDGLPALKHHSQCFQRAHVWARRMYAAGSVRSMKVFLFFTRKFISEHKYKWWFHVAPFVYVYDQERAQNQEIVLDPEFVREPREMHSWTDVFMMDTGSVHPPLYSSPDCTEVKRYHDYADNQDSQFCYTLKIPMYYYQPLDLQKLDEEGARVESFRDWDVQNSTRSEP